MSNDVASAEMGATPTLRERVEGALIVLTSDQRTRALAIALFGGLAFLSERYFFNKTNHG